MRAFASWGGGAAVVLWLLANPAAAQTNQAAPDVFVPGVPRQIASFALTDQYEVQHTIRLPLRRLTLFTLADKKGAAEVSGWVRPVHVLYGEQLEILGIAQVGAVPRWLQGQVRRHFRKNYDHPVLLDWEGKVAAAWGALDSSITVLLARPDGTVLFYQRGAATAEGLERLLRRVETALKEKP